MAELIGRRAIAQHLGVTCGEVARLTKRFSTFPVSFRERQYVAKTEELEEWRRARAAPAVGKYG